MIRHYLTAALAKFAKAPLATAANVLTLALGLACFAAAYGIAAFWASADRYHPGAERLYYIEQAWTGRPGGVGIAASAGLALDLRADMPELEAVAQIQDIDEQAASTGQAKAFLDTARADRTLFNVLAFDFVEGGPDTALAGPDDVVLTVDAARRLFGREPALGKTLTIEGEWEGRVSAVIAAVRQPSFMGHTDDAPVSFDMITTLYRDFVGTPPWNWIGPTTIVRLPPAMSAEAFKTRLDELVTHRAPPSLPGLSLTPVPLSRAYADMMDLRLLSRPDAGVSASAILLALGALILLVACVNTANLGAAQAESRVKETGMRKVLGAGRRALFAQHFVEAALLAIPALGLALAVVALAAPVLRGALGVDVTYFLSTDLRGAALVSLVALGCAAVSALYPALTAARVVAADALGQGSTRTGTGPLARALVGVQFLSASFLLIVLTVTQLQHTHLKARTVVGPDGPVAILNNVENLESAGVSLGTLETELRQLPQVRAVTAIDQRPWSAGGRFSPIALAPDADDSGESSRVQPIDGGYFDVFGGRLLAGRLLDPDRDTAGVFFLESSVAAPVPVMIDAREAEALGLTPAQAVGRTIYEPTHLRGQDVVIPARAGEVVGVVTADNPRLTTGSTGTVFELDLQSERANYPAVRLDPSDVPGALAAIGRVWDRLAPDIPLDARLADDLFEEEYAPYHAIAAVFVVLAACALIISTTGLLGIAVHVAVSRRREMGIRKTLGATAWRLARLLVVDFSKPVLAANLLAWPLGYLAAQSFLQPFADRVALTPAPFLLSMALTLAIAWAAVIGEVAKAARVRPADVLRHA